MFYLYCPAKQTLLKKIFFFTFLFILHFAFPQSNTCSIKISLLTCSPGEELYSTFGHTALRVTDSSTGTDIIFNYGTFEFAPDFYVKFIKGKLLYFLSVQHFNEFVYQYQAESRSIVEQDLLLDCTEREKLFRALQLNAREENRYYRYDFLVDNCTTRARDIVASTTDTSIRFHNILPAEVPTFRDLIHTYLDDGGQYWSKLGIDMLLGSRVDKKVSNLQAMFLPEYLMKGFDSATLGNQKLVIPPQQILAMPTPLNKKSLFIPSIVFSALLLLSIVLYFIRSKQANVALSVLDFVLFFSLGLAGLLMIFMWFGTEHTVCRDNFNLIWALPTHLVIAFLIHKEKEWLRNYFKAVVLINGMLLLTWFLLPQELNLSLIPFLILVMFRSWGLSKIHQNDLKKTASNQQ